jgi:hypothetical protein
MNKTPLSPDDVLRVASYRDRAPSRQAMVIAHAYHRLAADLAGRVGRREANWFAYATWSSKAIAGALDLSDGSPFLARLAGRLGLPAWSRRPFRALTLRLLGPSYQLGLALGNRTIFLETGSLVTGLWRGETLAGDPAALRVPRPGDAIEVRPSFISELVAPADEKHLDSVAALLTRAADTADPGARAELILGASIAMSAYEQARAQKALELVVYRPVRWMMRASWRSLLSALTNRPFHRLGLYTEPHENVPWPVRTVEAWWARLYTRFLGTLDTPISSIRLSRPLRPPPGRVPGELAPIKDAAVRELAEMFVPDPSKAMDGVADWLDYPERMRFIVGYFRLYIAVPEMFDQPYAPPLSDELEAELTAGTVPEPESEWFREKVDRRYGERAGRRGLRGWVVRRFYRSPLAYDPDAVELAGIELSEIASPRAVVPTLPGARP